MFDLHRSHGDNLGGEYNFLRNNASLTSKHMGSLPMRLQNKSHRVNKIMSVRRIDQRTTNMPKTAINFYNLRKGLYLKNAAHEGSASRTGSIKVMSANDRLNAKSTGILNAYGELAAQDLEIGGGVATQANLFHHNKQQNVEKASEIQSALSPKTMTSTA